MLLVKELAVRRVKHTRYLPLLTAALLCLWLAWLISLSRQLVGPLVPVWRLLAGSAITIAAAWYLVLPGTRSVSLPLGSAGFQVLRRADHAVIELEPGSHEDPASLETNGSSEPGVPTEANRSFDESAVESEAKTSYAIWRAWLRHVDRNADWLHGVLYFLLGTALFALAGSWRVWPLCAGLVGASQGVQWLQLRQTDISELVELLWAALGIGTALVAWGLMRRHPMRTGMQGPRRQGSADPADGHDDRITRAGEKILIDPDDK